MLLVLECYILVIRLQYLGLLGRVVHLITLLPTLSALMDGIDCNMNNMATRKTCDDNGIDFLIVLVV